MQVFGLFKVNSTCVDRVNALNFPVKQLKINKFANAYNLMHFDYLQSNTIQSLQTQDTFPSAKAEKSVEHEQLKYHLN